jgi:hypothetical protein
VRALSAAACCSLALGAACQGEDWIIAGELPRDMDGPNNPLDAVELASDLDGCPSSLELLEQRAQASDAASVAPSHVGRWRGDLDGAGFPSLALELEIDGSGAGTMLLGDTAGAPSPSDEDGYLCSVEASGVVCGSASGFVAGFAYPIAGARSRDGVLSFTLVTADPWGGWCAAREPVTWEDATQACGFAFGVLPEGQSIWSAQGCTRIDRDGGAEAIDCALMYALEYCQCARDACFARIDRAVDVGLALSQDGTELSGSLWYENGADAASIVLSRVP